MILKYKKLMKLECMKNSSDVGNKNVTEDYNSVILIDKSDGQPRRKKGDFKECRRG